MRTLYCKAIPEYQNNQSSFSQFFEEFSGLLTDTVVQNGRPLVLGDFNIHVDDPQCSEVRQILDLFDSANITQHVTRATHKHGHTLDLVLTRSEEAGFIKTVQVVDPVISDHSMVLLDVATSKPPSTKTNNIFPKLQTNITGEIQR